VILLDTSVLAYAVGAEHPLREPSRRIVEAITTGVVAATTTAGVIQAFVGVRSRRRPRGDAASVGRDFATLLSPLLSVEDRDLDLGLRIFERSGQLGPFDAVLAAVAINRDVEALVSADPGFRGVRQLRHIDIGGRQFDELLRGFDEIGRRAAEP
jgi:predicted nucleic acid-binding protein